jgi:subtilisin family serine protease
LKTKGKHVRRIWGIPAGLTALAVVVGGFISPVAAARHAGQQTASGPAGASSGRLSVTEVTLITGDRIRVITGPGGRQSAMVDARYARPGVAYDARTIPGPGRSRDLLVIPSDAAGLVGSGVLDERLFDVSELVRDGYTDAGTTALPLIFTYRPGAPRFAPVAHGIGAVTRALPSIDGSAVSEATATARQFWAGLTRPSPGGNGQLALVPQVEKVWLDGKVTAASAAGPAASAGPASPAARASSRFTGRGVLVADLDTGYDATNPDLKGVVAATKNFTSSQHGMKDAVGHGTWTASIIAGSGAGSGGKYRGVAPGARLLIGKVLGDNGTGTESQIIAGMQWAVAKHAKVVNMSFGLSDPVVCEDGTDPLSQALDSLSAAHGTLFVVAAGNDGQFGPGTIEVPGVATDALTAGAVDAHGSLAFFSSTGPRCGDDAVKPDITAPGVGVVGARAAGTALGEGDGIPGDGPVNAHYTRASGTSASAPYASGAAAVLAQEHPAWNGAELKTALMNAATPAAGTGVYGQGDGQVGLARAVKQTATATGSLSDLLRWPHTSPSVMTDTYHNDGTAAVTLSLGLAITGPDGGPAPAGMFGLSAAQVTVPAGGSAPVTVTVNPATNPDGLYGGWLTATGPGGAVLHTAIGVENQPQLETITFRGLDHGGHAVPGPELAAGIGAINLATGQLTLATASTAGVVTVAVPPGHYDLSSVILTAVKGAKGPSVTLLDDPEVAVGHDMTVTFDARRGVPISATVDRRVGNPWVVGALVETVAGTPYILWDASLPGDGPIEAAPTPRVTDRPYAFLAEEYLSNAKTRPVADGPGLTTLAYSLEFPSSGRIPGRLSFRVHDGSLALLRQTMRQQGRPMVFVDEIRLPESPAVAPFVGVAGTEFYLPAGGTVTEYLSPGPWETLSDTFYGPASGFEGAWGEVEPTVTYRAGHAYQDSWGSAALGVASDTTRLGNVITPVILPDSASASRHLDEDLVTNGLSGTITLRRGAAVVGTGSIVNQPAFTVPAAGARYTLSATMRRSVSWSTLGTAAQATWTFRSGHVAGAKPAVLPLWDVRIGGAFDSLDRAPAGRPFRLTVVPDVPAGAARAQITSIAVRASFDNGRTWHRLVLHRDGAGRWTTTVTPPRGAAFVSLSASLTDAAGNSTQQTVIRAYQM